ncbi:carboxymuconolactone decarboxylase family protein [Actinocorallia longicatena]|uniref:Carboxymuconolactone decarboxylase family protein n=1 Tax=Actinocorallia longicatena TaxID=111803 RepID=A0ABP6QBD8_9ACTN
MSDQPRIAPLPEGDCPPGVAGVVAALGPLNIFTTLGKNAELFDAWVGFGGHLLASKTICPRIRELIILRVAARTGCDYERVHHERIGRENGVTEAEIEALGRNLRDYAWDPGEWPVLAAVDELHTTSTISDGTWARLAGVLDEKAIIEVLMLIGQYTMLAFALNAMKVQPESS